jgi:hypothetical protein
MEKEGAQIEVFAQKDRRVFRGAAKDCDRKKHPAFLGQQILD